MRKKAVVGKMAKINFMLLEKKALDESFINDPINRLASGALLGGVIGYQLGIDPEGKHRIGNKEERERNAMLSSIRGALMGSGIGLFTHMVGLKA